MQLPTDGLYSPADVGEAALAYVKQAQLDAQSPDQRTVVLDVLLCDALYKGAIKKGDAYPTHASKVCL